MSQRYTVGIDFGTASARALLVDVATGHEVATAVHEYGHGVIDRQLPLDGPVISLESDWALQDPADYVRALQVTIPKILAESGARPEEVIGIGVDFTSCTMLPTTADGTPLCEIAEFRRRPHAWVKLWKHHAAQPEADRINETAERLGEPWLPRYGGRISSEWFFSKALQILVEAPEVYAAADRLIEGADWIVWQLTGRESRNACTAGYKALWSKQAGFPDATYFGALDPRMASIVDEKMCRDVLPPGSSVGGLSELAASWTGLLPGTTVAVANVDAHASVPAATVTGPGRMVSVMGTSTCHVLLGPDERFVEGMCGVVEDGVIPGWFGYEAGQSAVGDIFGWFTDRAVPPEYHTMARDRSVTVHQVLAEEAARLLPGESGLLALDWWNGNRSILVDVDLTGLLVGATLATDAPAVYRALIEATAFGTRTIVDSFRAAGVQVDEIVACGGLPGRNPFLMQVYADVTGLPISVAGSSQTPALGAAMFAAVAAGTGGGGYATIVDAADRMAHLADVVYRPTANHRPTYDLLYAEYVRLHDQFGRAPDGVMKTLKRVRDEALTQRRQAAAPEPAPIR
jgi:L-ribulokinase